MKLILFPLIFLIAFAVLGMLNIQSATIGIVGAVGTGSDTGWWDNTDYPGHKVADTDGTPTGEWGYIYIDGQGDKNWVNETGLIVAYYAIWDNPYGLDYNRYKAGFNISGAIGLIALVVALVVVAVLAGIRLFGSGVSDFSVSTLVKGGGLISLWAVFSVLAMGMITQIPLLGPIFYFFITGLYTVGIIGAIGGSSGDE